MSYLNFLSDIFLRISVQGKVLFANRASKSYFFNDSNSDRTIQLKNLTEEFPLLSLTKLIFYTEKLKLGECHKEDFENLVGTAYTFIIQKFDDDIGVFIKLNIDSSASGKAIINEVFGKGAGGVEVIQDPLYGDLTTLNSKGLILRSVGKDTLRAITNDLMKLLGTSCAVYEKNGDYAFGVLASGWCRKLNEISFKNTRGDSIKDVMESGKWTCHEACWNKASKKAIELEEIVDIKCPGGLSLYAVPIKTSEGVVGCINVGYGNPPTEKKVLAEIQKKYMLNSETLHDLAARYVNRPKFILDLAKESLKTSAKLIAEIVENVKSNEAFRQSDQKFRNSFMHAGALMALVDIKGKIIAYNERFEKLFGYSKKELLSLDILALIHPDYWEKTTQCFEELYSGKTTFFDYEEKILTKNKEEHWSRGIVSTVKKSSEKVLYYILQLHIVDESKNARQKLIESESRYEKAEEMGLFGAWEYNLQTTEFWGSTHAKHIYGFSNDEESFTTEKVETCIPEREHVHQALIDLVEKGNEYNLVFDILTYDTQQRKTIHSVAELIRDKSGAPLKVSGFIQDVTSRMVAERSLKASEEKYRMVANTAPFGIQLSDIHGKIIYSNPAHHRIYEYQTDELIGKYVWDLADIEEREFTKENYFELIENTPAPYTKIRNDRTQTNKLIQTQITWDYVRNEQGNIEGIVSILADITQQRKAEGALKESLVFNKHILNVLPMVLYICEYKSRRALFVNRHVEEVLGYSKEDIMAKERGVSPELTHPGDSIRIEEHFRNLADPNLSLPQTLEYRMRSAKGEWRWLQSRDSVFKYDSNGQPEELIGVVTDITEQKNAEHKLKILNEKLLAQIEKYTLLNEELNKTNIELSLAIEKAQQSDNLKKVFLNNMSHEVRTPLNGILGFVGLLDKPRTTAERRNYYVRIIQNSSQQLLRIIDDILEISTLETRQAKIREEEICLNSFLSELYNVFKIRYKDDGNEILFKSWLDDNASTISTDKSKLQKIVSNLLENAFKFTSEGTVELGCKLLGENIVIYVQDTGIGISPMNFDLVFERFAQEDKVISERVGGLGIGLSIAKENAHLIQGNITLESKKGIGTTFFLNLPYKPIDAECLKLSPKVHISSNPDQNSKSFKVLVAEDEEINYIYIQTLLSDYFELDCEVLQAKDGDEVVDMCRKDDAIDLVLMDIKMPKLNGLEATRKIKMFRPELTIICQSAYVRPEDRDRALAAGCSGFLTKPISQVDLLSLIRKVLG